MNNLAARMNTGQQAQPGAALAVPDNTAAQVSPASGPTAGLPAKLEYARFLATAGMLPSQYRERPGNILWAIEYGEMLGITTMAAITGVHVIEGKPGASAGLISALVRRAGHRLRIQGDSEHAVCEIVRADDPEYTFRVEWTVERAQQAGLLGKDIWKKYRPRMLKARAVTECARDACEEVLMGMGYTPEELGADFDPDVTPTATAGPVPPPVVPVGTPAPAPIYDPPPAAQPAPAAPPAPADDKPNRFYRGEPAPESPAAAEQPDPLDNPDLPVVFDAVIGQGDDEPSKPGQRSTMTKLLAKGGIRTDTDALAVLSCMAGRNAVVNHLERLTEREAAQVIRYLNDWLRAGTLADQLAAVLAAAQPAEEPLPDPETDLEGWHATGHPRRGVDGGPVLRDERLPNGCELCS